MYTNTRPLTIVLPKNIFYFFFPRLSLHTTHRFNYEYFFVQLCNVGILYFLALLRAIRSTDFFGCNFKWHSLCFLYIDCTTISLNHKHICCTIYRLKMIFIHFFVVIVFAFSLVRTSCEAHFNATLTVTRVPLKHWYCCSHRSSPLRPRRRPYLHG